MQRYLEPGRAGIDQPRPPDILGGGVPDQWPELQRRFHPQPNARQIDFTLKPVIVVQQGLNQREMQTETGGLEVFQDFPQVLAEIEREGKTVMKLAAPVDQRNRVALPRQHGQNSAEKACAGNQHFRGGRHTERAKFDEPQATASRQQGVPELFDIELRTVGVAGQVGQKGRQRAVYGFGLEARFPFQQFQGQNQFLEIFPRSLIHAGRLAATPCGFPSEEIG